MPRTNAIEIPGTTRGQYAKGIASREALLAKARELFNELGASTTFDDLARELGWTKGRITHHFSTKEDLILELMNRCSTELDTNGRNHGAINSIAQLASLYRNAFDIIDNYRAVYTMSLLGTVSRIDPHEMAERRMLHRLAQIRQFFIHLVDTGLLEPEVLDQRIFDPLGAATVTVFVSWPYYRGSMARDLSYLHARSVALRSGIYLLVPHMTGNARAQFYEVYPTL